MSDTKSFKYNGDDSEWNTYVSMLKQEGRTVQEDLTSKIRQEIQLKNKDERDTLTPSAHQDRLQQYIEDNYSISSIRPISGKIHINLSEPEHREFIESVKDDITTRIKTAVSFAITNYWYNKIANERIPTDPIKFEQLKAKRGSRDDLTREQAIRQEVSKLAMSTTGFFDAVDKIKVTYESPIIPKTSLSKLTENDIGSIIQFDCTILGPSQKMFDVQSGKYIQKILVQELENESIEYNPLVIKCVVHGSSTTNLASGQRKRILGKYQVEPTVNGQKETFEKHLIIDAYDVRNAEEEKEVLLDSHQINIAKEAALSDETSYLDNIISSFCPKIYGRKTEKLALILSLLGGSNHSDTDNRFRSQTHLMLIGESDTGKSELIKFTNSVAYKSSIIDGSNTTGVGILFALDEYNGTKILKSGMMIQNSGGHLIIDEFDKMPKSEQKKVNNAMEQQRANYNKGGHIGNAETKTAIIACCNPEKERWNDSKEIIDNMPFDASTISRYDVIIRLKHESTEQEQRAKMKHIMSLKRGIKNGMPIATPEYLKGLFNYLRKKTPVFTDEAETMIIDKFVDFQLLEQPEGALQIETRQMEGIQRLCEAYAKLTFKEEIDTKIVENILGFYKNCLGTLGMKTDNGVHQVDMRGHSINKEEYFEERFKELEDEKTGDVSMADFGELLLENPKFFRSDKSTMVYIESRKRSGWLYEPRPGILRRQAK